MTRIKLAFDTDPGVDDALALMLAWHHPDVDLALITTVAGNVPLSVGTRNAKRLVALLSESEPRQAPLIAQGESRPLAGPLVTATHVHGDDGLSGASMLKRPGGLPLFQGKPPSAKRDAPQRLVELAQEHGNDLVIVAVGPLTNVARAIELAPATMARVKRLVVMGGAVLVPGNITPVAEFNFYVDPYAAEKVMGAGIPTTLIPLDVTQRVRLHARQVATGASGPRGNLERLARHFIKQGFGGRWQTEGMPMHDPLAVAAALVPEVVQTTSMPVRVETDGALTRGQVITDRRQHAETDKRHKVDVALDVDVAKAVSLIASHFAGADNRTDPKAQNGVAILGGANIDLTVPTPKLPAPGETVQGKDLQTGFGGKGANQAVAARRAGSEVHFFSLLGNDSGGDDFREAIGKEGIELHEPPTARSSPTGAALICVNAAGENLIAVAPGANAKFRWHSMKDPEATLKSCKVMAGPLELPMPSTVAAYRQAKALGLVTILNAAPAAPIPAKLRRCVDILVVNETEAAFLSGKPVENMKQANAAVLALQGQGFPCVILTLGAAGALWSQDGKVRRQRGYTVTVKDTTGAGDTFVGYLANALARGIALDGAIDLAARAGALAVTRAGAQSAIPKLAKAMRL